MAASSWGSESDSRDEPRLLATEREFRQELDERIELGREILGRDWKTEQEFRLVEADYRTWNEFNKDWLRARFSSPSLAKEYGAVAHRAWRPPPSIQRDIDDLVANLEEKLRRLESIGQRLRLYVPAPKPEGRQGTTKSASIFLVHGKDHERRDKVADFLRKVTERDITILDGESNKGRTVLEKFEDHAMDAAYAVVLLTGDDDAAHKGEQLRSRARQNVVFELGFFFGSLGRKRVAVLHEEGIELPSDIGGLAYIPLDSASEWRTRLGRELRDARIDVDLNKIM